MKHKRQTLGKQSEDGSDKDSQSTKSTKSEKSKSLICEESKKSCQNCDLPAGMLNDHLARTTNNFSTNSNGSTGMSSADSNSSCFEKMEEDSRSNEGSGALTSPPVKKHDDIVVKLESSAICCSSSPKSQQKKPNLLTIKDASQLMSPDVKNCPVLPPGSLTPSTPSTPSAIPMASPLASSPYQSSKSHSPSQTPAFQNQSPPILAAQRNSTPTTYPSPPLHRPSGECPFKVAQYRGCPASRENLYQHQQLQYPNQPQQLHRAYMEGANVPYARQAVPRVNGMHVNNVAKVTAATTATTCTTRQSYPCQQFNQQYCGYNGNAGHSEPYQSYQRSNYGQHYGDEYAPSSVNYGSYQNSYADTNSNAAFYGATNHQHNYHPAEYGKHFYDEGYHNSQQEAPYSPDYPTGMPPATNSSVVMTPPSSVRGDSEQYNTFHQFYGNNAAPTNTQLHNQNMVLPDNSNSSSEFNFLSNLANDFAPEYYQLS